MVNVLIVGKYSIEILKGEKMTQKSTIDETLLRIRTKFEKTSFSGEILLFTKCNTRIYDIVRKVNEIICYTNMIASVGAHINVEHKRVSISFDEYNVVLNEFSKDKVLIVFDVNNVEHDISKYGNYLKNIISLGAILSNIPIDEVLSDKIVNIIKDMRDGHYEFLYNYNKKTFEEITPK